MILSYLSSEWLNLRLVSKWWNETCLRLIWKRVVFTREVPRPHIASLICWSYDERTCRATLSPEAFMVLDYDHFRRPIASLQNRDRRIMVSEIRLYFENLPRGSEVDAFDNMAELFPRVGHAQIVYTSSSNDEWFEAFQRMLNAWRAIAKFTLDLTLQTPREGADLINIDHMQLQNLIITMGPLGTAPQLRLPLSRENGTIPIDLPDLPFFAGEIQSLTVYVNRQIFQPPWIPNSVKYLHIVNAGGNYTATGGSLIVPSRVEHLRITERRLLNNRALDLTTSVTAHLDLSQARMLKVFHYGGQDVSGYLIPAVRAVADTMELLTIECDSVMPGSTYDFRQLAAIGLTLKYLQISIHAFGEELSEYLYFHANFPALERLRIEDFDLPETWRFYFKLRFTSQLIESFLRGSSRLSFIQLYSDHVLDWMERLSAWIRPHRREEEEEEENELPVTYVVDVPLARKRPAPKRRIRSKT
ncbi:hypothetical protein TRVA0_017S00892 [Trichomonascus vanleenenianus]|uniref:uncharacterized protein n=1 Tax=Trichomonascus vanleenenianus TaxID=2268995 RepID=UPI003EC97048